MLLTSPINETDIVFGKWLGALSLYLLILISSIVEFAIFTRGQPSYGTTAVLTYTALVFSGGSLLAVGEWISALTKHQSAAATGTLLLCLVTLRLFSGGVLHVADSMSFAVLMLLGWMFTFRSIRALREAI